MIVGVVKEIKKNENRVALTPGGVAELRKFNHQVIVQAGAGAGSGFSDEEYLSKGASLLPTAEEVYGKAEMILKVKEPVEPEYDLIRKDQVIFTYFHFASSRQLTAAMTKAGAICIAYETVELDDRTLPLLIPMSEVAGRMAIQEGAVYLEKQHQGKGVLLGGVPGVKPAHVVILGGGIVGTESAKMAAGLGAQVTLMDINVSRLRYLSNILPANVTTLFASSHNIEETIQTADLIIGAVLIPGAKAPVLISRAMLKSLQPGTVLIDVAVDQGGCIETCRPTTHDDPTFIIDGIVHYCVANMPGAVPFTSTLALTNVTLPYAVQIASKGWKQACNENKALQRGLNIMKGSIVNQGVAEAFGLPLKPVEQFLN